MTDYLKFTIYDEDLYNDAFVAQKFYRAGELCPPSLWGKDSEHWFPLAFCKKKAADLLLNTKFIKNVAYDDIMRQQRQVSHYSAEQVLAMNQ